MNNKVREKFNNLCSTYDKEVQDLCTCKELFSVCNCEAEKRYRERTGNVLFKENDGLHIYIKVDNESMYAVIDKSDKEKDIFLVK